jgi:pyruvate-ferredoxin/flavodoxin oxidoreductase
VDDVTNFSLKTEDGISTIPSGTYEAKFFGVGSDGTVGANKNSIKIIGENTGLYAQAYFAYDSKKSGGITVSHLRFGSEQIRSTYLVNNPDFVACHVQPYLEKYDILAGLKPGGTFLLNSSMSPEQIKESIPASVKRYLAQNKISFYAINANAIADELGMPGRINNIMQAAFFKVSAVIPYETALGEMKDAVKKTYGKKGEKIVKLNYDSIDRGGDMVIKIDVPAEWASLPEEKNSGECASGKNFINRVAKPVNALKGNSLPVSAFIDRADGTFPNSTSASEKRGIATHVPEWIASNCIQCNQCSFVCPHSVIRPFLVSGEEAGRIPFKTTLPAAKGKDLEGYGFRIQLSPLDCYGCESCVNVCPSKEKALVMKPIESQTKQIEKWNYFSENISYKDNLMDRFTVKGSQFSKPSLNSTEHARLRGVSSL